MAALRSLEPEQRHEIETELARTRADRERFQQNLARLEAEQAPHSYRGKLKAQIRSCQRHEERFRRLLEEAA